jgi:hypothetical protein
MCISQDNRKRLKDISVNLAILDSESTQALHDKDIEIFLVFEAQAQALRTEMYLINEELESRTWR